jgi:hypothetical protein
MVVYGALTKAAGKSGVIKVAAASASITGTGSIDTGLKTIFGPAMAAVQDAETTLPSNATAAVTSVSGGTVNVVVISHDSAANAVSTTAKTVGVMALGE